MSQISSIAKELDPSNLPGPVAWRGADIKATLGVVLLGFAMWFMPVPEGLTQQTWHLFTIFVATLVAIITKPLPVGSVALISVAAVTMTQTLSIEQALGSYNNKIIWLVVCAFLIARGFIKSGLGARVAYMFVSKLGQSTLGLSYGLVVTELLMAPFVPSNAARGGGIMYPIVMSLNHEYGSIPHTESSRRIGAYLISVMFHANVITSAMFLTAMAANPLAVSFAASAGIEISWTDWAVAAFVPGVISLILLPLTMMKLCPPEVLKTPEAKEMALAKLKDMGSLKYDEIVMALSFSLLLFLWVFGKSFGVDATSAAFIGLSILLFSGVLSWKDITSEETAWTTFIWLGVLLMLASELTNLGMMDWFSTQLKSYVVDFNWITTLGVICFVYFYTHYFFASMTAHVTSMYSALLLVLIGSDCPPLIAALSLGFISSLCGGLTHYGTGSAPVYFGAGYVPVKEWWKNNALISILMLAIWGGGGLIWWKLIGLW